MSRQTEIEKIIPAIYKRSTLNLLFHGYIKGVKSTLHTMTTNAAIDMFMDDFGLNDDEFNRDSAIVIYDRMQKELKDARK